MSYQLTFLYTDVFIDLIVIAFIVFFILMRKKLNIRMAWQRVFSSPFGMIAAVVLLSYTIIGLLDSIHFHPRLQLENNSTVLYSSQVVSLLDILVRPLGENEEQSYSAPFALRSFTKTNLDVDAKPEEKYTRLKYGAVYLKDESQRLEDVFLKIAIAAAESILFFVAAVVICAYLLKRYHSISFRAQFKKIYSGKTTIAWREMLLTLGVIILMVFLAIQFATHYHILGTNKVGEDIFYESIKSIRTALIIGCVTTFFMLPFAILFGTLAGYLGGWVDDVIQYVYTTLSSIPGVLLISASILALQIYISNHPELFPNLAIWADVRLLGLCIILGLTSWTTLCRLLRGETLKIRELDYVKAARAMGVKHHRIISTHILSNILHIIVITIVLDFSSLVLAEAILSYVGVGVDPTTMSWGNMINSARLELAREPVVWWPLTSAFVFMFGLVFAANVFADKVRDAFDPRLKGVEQNA
jgi:peptide/nickel transport system permease protein